jgi:DNA-binding MarR family transcriptional regulator
LKEATESDLVKTTQSQPITISRCLIDLVQTGLVKMKPSIDDRRLKGLYILTSEGETIASCADLCIVKVEKVLEELEHSGIKKK